MSTSIRVFVALLVLNTSLSEATITSSEEQACSSETRSLLQAKTVAAQATVNDKASYHHPAWLNECKSIYLDVGSNIGVQVRKLYEPEKFPGAPILPLFQKKFGMPQQRRQNGKTSGICALGFEPNPLHKAQLQKVEDDYLKKGYHVHFYPFAVAGRAGKATFQVSDSSTHQDWGAKILSMLQLQAQQYHNVTVEKIDFYDFLQDLPKASKVKLMKMDIEGGEWDTMARLLPANALCDDRIEEAFIEVHSVGDISHWKGPRQFATLQARILGQHCGKAHPTAMSQIDDESYLDGVHPDDGKNRR
eukprot:TRINITY_DN602_c0_g1_i2.p1 TRINITY_DN602_c0_g1~~TRINITY_DN602_c0_g1_i2.p1  ORF type:complete len:304 (+),score=77.91 TRINITY_DN602_c0_g1_i2:155-1066(+)